MSVVVSIVLRQFWIHNDNLYYWHRSQLFFLSNLYWYDDNESNVGSDGGAGTMRSTYYNLTDNDGDDDNQYQYGDSNMAG